MKEKEKEILNLKEKLHQKDHEIKAQQLEIDTLKSKVNQNEKDVQEFKHTNERLTEAKRKDAEIEARQKDKRIAMLESYIQELHSGINKRNFEEILNRNLNIGKDNDNKNSYKSKIFIRRPFGSIEKADQPLYQKSNISMEKFQINRPVKLVRIEE